MFQLIRGQGGNIGFPISMKKNTKLVEDIEDLLSVKFRQIQFSGLGVEVENVKC